jgi:transposase
MATRSTFNQPTDKLTHRTFSEEFRRKKVNEIEQKVSTVADICKEYGVTKAAVYKWIYKYSRQMKKKVRVIVEEESDTRKIALLKHQIAELEQKLGQKQIQLEFMDKVIDLAEETYQIDIKKKFGGKP